MQHLKVNILALLLLCLLPAFPLRAQSATDAFRNYRTATGAHESISMDVEVFTYATARSRNGVKIGSGIMRSSKGSYYSKFMNDELLSTREHVLILDHSSRSMTLFTDLKDGKRNKEKFMPDVDSLLKMNDSVVYKGIIGNEEVVELFNNTGYIRKTEIRFNIQTHFINRIVYFYAPADNENDFGAYKAEVIYKKVSFDAIDKTVFDEAKYILYKNKRWQPAAGFAAYKLNVTTPPKP